jgi:hypothetical protein
MLFLKRILHRHSCEDITSENVSQR